MFSPSVQSHSLLSHTQNFALLICSKHPACQSSSESSAYRLPRLPCSSVSGPHSLPLTSCPALLLYFPLPSDPPPLPPPSTLTSPLDKRSLWLWSGQEPLLILLLPFSASLRPAWLLAFACGGAVTYSTHDFLTYPPSVSVATVFHILDPFSVIVASAQLLQLLQTCLKSSPLLCKLSTNTLSSAAPWRFPSSLTEVGVAEVSEGLEPPYLVPTHNPALNRY